MYLNVLNNSDASKLSELLKDGDWMVLYYAEWCGHCQAMKPEWEKVVQKMKESGKVNLADVKSDVIDKLAHKPQIEGFPTIKMYNNGKVVAKFQDERSADKLMKFAMNNSNTSSTKKSVKTNNTAVRKSIQDLLATLPSANNNKPSPSPSKTSQRKLNAVKSINNGIQRISMKELKDEILQSHRSVKNNQAQKDMVINLEENAPAQPTVEPSPLGAMISNKPASNMEVTMDNLLEPLKAPNTPAKKTLVQKEKAKKKRKKNSKKLVVPAPAPAAPAPAPVVPAPAPAAPAPVVPAPAPAAPAPVVPAPAPVVHAPAPVVPAPAPVVPAPAPVQSPELVAVPNTVQPAAQPVLNLDCSEIRKAKPCKANPKCEFDYSKSKCKSKKSQARNSNTRSKRIAVTKSKKVVNKMGNNVGTKEVFRELIKSFNRIGSETRKDSQLLKKASKKL
jgi:thiol-disulfide isomerase/thioredoxin